MKTGASLRSNGRDNRRAADAGKVQIVRDSSSRNLNLSQVLPASDSSTGYALSAFLGSIEFTSVQAGIATDRAITSPASLIRLKFD